MWVEGGQVGYNLKARYGWPIGPYKTFKDYTGAAVAQQLITIQSRGAGGGVTYMTIL